MSIPTKTTVLVIGGGPGGSYTASALAREGIDTVLLEADIFPRYHIGESLVASTRYLLKFIDLDDAFVNHGFVRKNGSVFKLNHQKEAYTDFVLIPGSNNYAWNVIRSEADELFFKHAGKCGAKTFDGVKVDSIQFDTEESLDSDACKIGRPKSATWTSKGGDTGTIKFDYLVDASGRAGILSTKYLKNRSFNQYLKNVASWGYWRGATPNGVGTPVEGQPYFEALQDGSGWVWFIPLHNGTTSIGVVMNQEMCTKKKKASTTTSAREFYIESVKDAHHISGLLADAKLEGKLGHASDWSYSASKYGGPYMRIVGDAGAFIDPYFSSGVHLALSGGLSAAISICASIRGDCNEADAWNWHSHTVSNRFNRFLLVVLTATRQIRAREAPVMNNEGESGFDDAFTIIRPVIQGIADIPGKVARKEVSDAVNFTIDVTRRTKDQEDTRWIDKKDDALVRDEKELVAVISELTKAYTAADVYKDLEARVEKGRLGLVMVDRTTLAHPGDAFGGIPKAMEILA